MTPQDLEAIRARDAGGGYVSDRAGLLAVEDRRALLVEVDRLMTAIATELVTASMDRARIRLAVEALPAYLLEAAIPLASLDFDTTQRVELSPASVILTKVDREDGLVDRASVLAVIDPGE